MIRKKRIGLTLDRELIRMIDNRREIFGMKRSTFVNFKLKKALRDKNGR